MKYIIYYFFYITADVDKHISTCLYIKEDIVSFYVYDVGYIDWKIKDKEESVDSKGICLMATYHLEYEDMKALVKTNCEMTIIVIWVEDQVEHITLKKKR